MSKDCSIIIPYYSTNINKSDYADCILFNHLKNQSPLEREFLIQRKVYNIIDQYEDYVGIFSPKFVQKSNLSFSFVKSQLKKNPNYDVYLFNPFPLNSYFTFNVWDHAEVRHPGITNAILKDIPAKLLNGRPISKIGRMRNDITLYCSFWIGNNRFWKEYMSFLLPIYEYLLDKELLDDPKYCCSIFQNSYFPYIMERLLSTFLYFNNDFNVWSYQYPKSKIEEQYDLPFLPDFYKKTKDIINDYDQKKKINKTDFYNLIKHHTPQNYLYTQSEQKC